MSASEPALPPREALADVRVRAPTRGNRRLERLLEAVNADDQVKAWWHVSAVNATRRLQMSDHSWVHIQVVLNIALRLGRLLFRRGVVPSVVTDYGMNERDAEVVIAAACLLHCVGMSIHRDDHERFSLFLTADRLGGLLAGSYEEPERTIIVSEALHAIIGHRREGAPFTVEAGIVRVADALDMARGRSRVPFEAGHQNIHSLSAYAIEEVKISPGRDRAVRVEIEGALRGIQVPHPAEAVAVGGSATSLRQLAGPLLDAAAFARSLTLLGSQPAAEVARRFGLELERVRLLPAGLLILEAASQMFGTSLQIARGGVREGVLLEASE